ncbi:MAG TPA: hypothetical protein VHG92_14010 [Afifellaceae bacterium]|nr:hypothetical protein [Afifellaceae bacterium]
MTVRGQLVAIAVLAACSAGLAQAVHFLWTTPLAVAALPAATVGGEPALRLPQRLEPGGLSTPPSLVLSEILGRPLFSPTRRPPIPEPQPVAEPLPAPRVVTFVAEEPEPPVSQASDLRELRLIGVLRADEQRRALVTTPEEPEGIWLAEGQELLGWRIVAIAPNEIEVASGEERHTLSLQVGQ